MSQSLILDALLRARYSGLDWNTHLDDMRARLQVKFASDYNDFAVSSQGILILDVVAYGLDTLSFYLDRRATDTYISTARTRRSVARLSRQLGYKMRASVSSSVDLTVSVDNPQAFAIPVPQGFQFKGPDDIIFECAEAVTFPAGSSDALTIPTYQGETVTESFVSDGTSNQVFELSRVPDGSFVTGGYVQVLVDGVLWEEKEFLEFSETDQFEVGYNDDPPTVRFGDGVAGNIPTTGASISVTYVVSRGKSGLVNAGTIEDVVTPLVVSFTQINLTITNPLGSVGGDDPEDLEHAKTYAPKVYKSRYVAVTREDYEALAGSYADPLFGRVAVAQALSARSADSDLALKNIIASIETVVNEPVAEVQSAVISLEQDFVDLTDLTATLDGTLSDIASETTNMQSYGETVRNSQLSIRNDTVEVDSYANAGKTAVNTISIDTSDKLTVSTRDALLGYFDSILSQPGTISSTAESAASTTGSLLDGVEAIGTDLTTSGSFLYTADKVRENIDLIVGDEATPSGMFIQTSAIQVAVVDNSVEIGGYLDDIFDHVDKLLAADCKANLVVVPILSRDVSGFYAAPSIGLIKSLESFLEERNEVTQTVEVVSGENYLLPAVITAEIGVLPSFSQSATEAAVVAVIEVILKDRKFGQSLYLSVLSQAIIRVSGVGFVNVTIDGSYQVPMTSPPVLNTDHLDSDGNLILSDSEVLTKGNISISSIQMTAIDTTKLVPKLSS